jgi:hypothetical protein
MEGAVEAPRIFTETSGIFADGSALSEIALVLVRLDHIASLIVNADHNMM